MNDVTRKIAGHQLDSDPSLVKTYEEFDESQKELDQLLELMGIRQVMVEVPPKGNADAVLHGNVSATDR